MSDYQIVSLISLVGCLILATRGFSARTMGLRNGLYMAAAWAGIFAVVILFIDLLR